MHLTVTEFSRGKQWQVIDLLKLLTKFDPIVRGSLAAKGRKSLSNYCGENMWNEFIELIIKVTSGQKS